MKAMTYYSPIWVPKNHVMINVRNEQVYNATFINKFNFDYNAIFQQKCLHDIWYRRSFNTCLKCTADMTKCWQVRLFSRIWPTLWIAVNLSGLMRAGQLKALFPFTFTNHHFRNTWAPWRKRPKVWRGASGGAPCSGFYSVPARSTMDG